MAAGLFGPTLLEALRDLSPGIPPYMVLSQRLRGLTDNAKSMSSNTIQRAFRCAETLEEARDILHELLHPLRGKYFDTTELNVMIQTAVCSDVFSRLLVSSGTRGRLECVAVAVATCRTNSRYSMVVAAVQREYHCGAFGTVFHRPDRESLLSDLTLIVQYEALACASGILASVVPASSVRIPALPPLTVDTYC